MTLLVIKFSRLIDVSAAPFHDVLSRYHIYGGSIRIPLGSAQFLGFGDRIFEVIEPVSGTSRYRLNLPQSILWIHVSNWLYVNLNVAAPPPISIRLPVTVTNPSSSISRGEIVSLWTGSALIWPTSNTFCTRWWTSETSWRL